MFLSHKVIEQSGGSAMKSEIVKLLGFVAAVGVVVAVGCRQKSASEPADSAGLGERAGAALDQAAAKTVAVATNVAEKATEAAKATAAAAKDVAGQAVEKTGAALERAGTATEKAGDNMQK